MAKVMLWCRFVNNLLTDGSYDCGETLETLQQLSDRVRLGEAKPVFLCGIGEDGLLERQRKDIGMIREASFEAVPRLGEDVTPCSVLQEDDRYPNDSGFSEESVVTNVIWGQDGIPTLCLSTMDMSYAYGTRLDHVDVWEVLREDGWRETG